MRLISVQAYKQRKCEWFRYILDWQSDCSGIFNLGFATTLAWYDMFTRVHFYLTGQNKFSGSVAPSFGALTNLKFFAINLNTELVLNFIHKVL